MTAKIAVIMPKPEGGNGAARGKSTSDWDEQPIRVRRLH
jgi:hypothetical protein